MKQRIMFLLLALVLCIGLALPAAADTSHIVDEAGLLEQDELDSLNQTAAALADETGAHVMLAMTRAAEEGAQAYGEALYQQCFGQADGWILVLDYGEKQWNLVPFGRFADRLTEEDMDDLFDAFDQPDTYFDGVLAYLLKAQSMLGGQAVANTAEAATPKAPTDADGHPVRLYDAADLLTDGEEDTVLQRLNAVSAAHNMDVVVVTANTLGGKSVRAYADDFYDYNGYGLDSENSGVLLLVSMEDRDWYISTTGDGIRTFTDAGIQYIGEQIVSDLSDGDYEAAFLGFADQCEGFMTQAAEGDPYDVGSLPKAPLEGYWVVVAIAIGLVIALMVTGSMKAKLKSVRWQPAADSYVRPGSMILRDNRDTFLYTHVDRTLRPQNDSSSGGSSTHSGSSGTSHGGGGGKF